MSTARRLTDLSRLLLPAAAALTFLALQPATAVAAAAAKASGDEVPLDLGGEETGGQQVGPGGGSVARVIVGLLIVVAVIYGVTWLLKQLKGGPHETATGHGLEQLTALPLQGGGALSLVRVGDELLLLGSGSGGATTLRRYDENEARALGLWPDDAASSGDGPSAGGSAGGNVLSVLGRTIIAMRSRTVRDPATGAPSEVVLRSSAAAPPAPRGLLFRDAPPTATDAQARAFVAPGADAPAAAPPVGVRPVASRTVATLVARLRALTVRR